MIFTSSIPLKPEHLVDHRSIPQFTLDDQHPLRPHRSGGRPWFIDCATGRQYDLEEVRERTDGLANALQNIYGIKEGDVVVIFSPNDIDYPIAIWAIHRLGAIASCANPSYTAPELEHQLRETNAKLIICHSSNLPMTLSATKPLKDTLPTGRIAVITPPVSAHHESADAVHRTSSPPLRKKPTGRIVTPLAVEELIQYGLSGELGGEPVKERILSPGEAKQKVAFYSFSSGTTGRPKAVAISHYNITSNVVQTASFVRSNDPSLPWEEQRYRDGDVGLAVLPMYHIFGLVMVLHASVFLGLPLVVLPKYTFTDFLKSIVTYRITHLFVVPPQMVSLIKQPEVKNYDLSCVRVVMGGAAPVSDTVQRALEKVLVNANIGQGYGTTETPATISFWPLTQNYKATSGSAGQLLSGWEGRLLKLDGSFAGYDEPGELLLRGPSVALRYEKNLEATNATFRDGWCHTGDQVVIKPNGDIFVVDRLKEVLKVRGNQVAPAELEGHLLGHKDVLDSCVVSIPDEYSGELPLAYIVLQPDTAKRANEDKSRLEAIRTSIAKHVSDQKIRYKWLDGGVFFIDAIPKNPSGKILRRVLRDQARAEHKTAAPKL